MEYIFKSEIRSQTVGYNDESNCDLSDDSDDYNENEIITEINDAIQVSNKLIEKVLFTLKNNETAIPYVSYNDRQLNRNNELKEKIKNIQTPQGFKFKLIYSAHLKLWSIAMQSSRSLVE